MMKDQASWWQGHEETALLEMAAAEPQWTGLIQAGELMPTPGPTLLHAGPPFASPAEVPTPVLNSLAAACVYERWADSLEHGEAMVKAGAVELLPAQDLGVVVPLAAAVSPSMQLAVVSATPDGSTQAHVPLHDGIVHGALFGRRDEHIPAQRRWVDSELATWAQSALSRPLPLLALLSSSLDEGDDGHSRVIAGSRLLIEALSARSTSPVPEQVATFLHQSPGFALNIWMATASALLSVLDDVAGSGLVTRAGANGVRFGLQVSGKPGVWITTPSPPVEGSLLAEHHDAHALPAIGDSAVIDVFGLGGQTLATAGAVRAGVEDFLPADALERPERILRTSIATLAGRRAVTDARRVVETGHTPLVLLGMLDQAGTRGRIGAGVAQPPVELFASALEQLNDPRPEVQQA